MPTTWITIDRPSPRWSVQLSGARRGHIEPHPAAEAICPAARDAEIIRLGCSGKPGTTCLLGVRS